MPTAHGNFRIESGMTFSAFAANAVMSTDRILAPTCSPPTTYWGWGRLRGG